MQAFLLLLLATLPASSRATSGFTGRWTGQGTWVRDSHEGETVTWQTLTMVTSAQSFRFQECWAYYDAGDRRAPCIESTYLRVADSLYLNGKKVGDMFPTRVQIYDGNSRVGEQIILERETTGVIRYRYSYINIDGASERREARLWPDDQELSPGSPLRNRSAPALTEFRQAPSSSSRSQAR